MKADIGHILDIMETIAPAALAESWDRIGLHVGEKSWPVRKIWVALDPTVTVLEEASRNDVDLLVCHHPLIFKPVSRIDPGTEVGKMIDMALRHRIGVLPAHTNLDSVPGGVNDVLAELLGLAQSRILVPAPYRQFKLITYVPEDHEQSVAQALFDAGAGQSKKYSHAAFRTGGTGSFKPLEGSQPFIGETGQITYVRETRLEVHVGQHLIKPVLHALRKAHPYEEVVYDLYPIESQQHYGGLGRKGELKKETSLKALAELLKEKLGAPVAKVIGDPDRTIKTVALCGGSGKSLTDVFIKSGADVFITGDIGYHEGLTIAFHNRALIDIGHFYSEYPIVPVLAKGLSKALDDKGFSVEVEPYQRQTCCFRYM